MNRLWVLLAVVVGLGCGHDVPAHDVNVTSDCNGPVRVARFHFDAFDFEDNCTGGLLSGECSNTIAVAHRVSGDLEAARLELRGYESGPTEYRLYLPFNLVPNDESIVCQWFVDSDRQPTEGKRQTCITHQCFAELEVED